MNFETYLIKSALDPDEVLKTVVGPHGVTEIFSSPPVVGLEKLRGKRLTTEGREGLLLAFLDPGVYLARKAMKKTHPDWYAEIEEK